MLELFRQCDIYFSIFIIGYGKNPAELQLLKINMVVIVFRNLNRQNEIQPNSDLFQFHLQFTLEFSKTCTSRSRSNIKTLFHSGLHFFLF
jgi:hypothetical protein